MVSEAGEPGYRAKQIMDAVVPAAGGVAGGDFDSAARDSANGWLQSGVTVGAARIEKKFVSVDGTVRYLIAFGDGQSVETVWMPEGDGGEAGDGSARRAEARLSQSGSCSGERFGRLDDLHFQPGRLCRRLPVLPDGACWA